MTHIDFNTITNLVWICSVKMSPKCCFDAWTILKKLLKNKKISYTRQSVKKEEIEVMVYVQNNNLLTIGVFKPMAYLEINMKVITHHIVTNI